MELWLQIEEGFKDVEFEVLIEPNLSLNSTWTRTLNEEGPFGTQKYSFIRTFLESSILMNFQKNCPLMRKGQTFQPFTLGSKFSQVPTTRPSPSTGTSTWLLETCVDNSLRGPIQAHSWQLVLLYPQKWWWSSPGSSVSGQELFLHSRGRCCRMRESVGVGLWISGLEQTGHLEGKDLQVRQMAWPPAQVSRSGVSTMLHTRQVNVSISL